VCRYTSWTMAQAVGVCILAGTALFPVHSAVAADEETSEPQGIWRFEMPLLESNLKDLPVMDITLRPSLSQVPLSAFDQGRGVGVCPQVTKTHTSNLNFQGGQGQLTAPPGLVETEIAAVTYELPATDFPFLLINTSVIFLQSHFNSTTTEYTYYVWEGNPDTGQLIASFSSDGTILPHVTLPFQGGNAAVVQLTVDPSDPEQIIVNNNGTNRFTVGVSIDAHNNPPVSGCTCLLGLGTLPAVCCPVDTNSNAFIAMDNEGPNQPLLNWLWARDCPGGTSLCFEGPDWIRFDELPTSFVNDWAFQVIYEPLTCVQEPGACCLPDGSCNEWVLDTCNANGGAFQGEGTDCISADCVQPDGACCFPPGEFCIDLTEDECIGTGEGVWAGFGTMCATTTCDPIGACCMPDGTCDDNSGLGVREADCISMGGVFQGHETDCTTVECPAPEGACCFANGFCTVLTQEDCEQVATNIWHGDGTDCTDADMNGTADICEEANDCPWDVTSSGGGGPDGEVSVPDFFGLLQSWGPCVQPCPFDFTGPEGTPDSNIGTQDFFQLLQNWGPCDA
jgi:hypothetical protein